MFPIVRSQRFWSCRLNELLDLNSYQVEVFMDGCRNARDVAERVIRFIEYPFYLGQPDDKHVYNAFHGKWCKTVSLDYWQSATETAALRIGDCEDSSILGVACSLRLGCPAYVVFGYVYDDSSGEILGGHAWYYVKDARAFGDDEWHYVESTLDVPPSSYPVVKDITAPFVSGGWRLIPEMLWNDKEYVEVELSWDLQLKVAGLLRGKKKSSQLKVSFLDLPGSVKEARRKYEALASMWRSPVKPLRKAGKLSKLRWRK